jgi:hypothetical protein
LQAGALALGGLTLADVLAARAASGAARQETSVILLYLHGGPFLPEREPIRELL